MRLSYFGQELVAFRGEDGVARVFDAHCHVWHSAHVNMPAWFPADVDYEDYVGIGSGAFSYLDGVLYVNTLGAIPAAFISSSSRDASA